MGALNWLTHYAAAKASGSGTAMIEAIAVHDPDTADQVNVADLRQQIHDIGLEVSDAIDREHRDHTAVDELTERLAAAKQAAGIFGNQLKSARDTNDVIRITDLTNKVTKLIATIKEIGGVDGDSSKSGTLFDAIVKHHNSEERLHQRQQIHTGLTARLTTHAAEYQETRQKLADAKLDELEALRDRADAERLAGIVSQPTGADAATQAMQKRLAETQKRTRAAQLDAAAFQQAKASNAGTDDLIHEALGSTVTQATDPLAELQALTGNTA